MAESVCVMKRFFILLAASLSLAGLHGQRININVNGDWKFGSSPDGSAALRDFDDSNWESLDLPHTWNKLDGQDGGGNYIRDTFWYRKHLVFDENWSGKKAFLRFGAANMQTEVYVNGHLAGTHTGGYAAFVFDISDYIEIGTDNVIAVRVDNSAGIDAAPLSADFTFFGGITRDVNLILTDRTFISPLDHASPGIYITPYDITPGSAKVNTRILLGNHHDTDTTVHLVTVIRDRQGAVVDSANSGFLLPRDSIIEVSQNQVIDNPVLWNGLEDPCLYDMEVRLITGGVTGDVMHQPLGIREFSVDPDSGFYLNGERYPLHGVAMHEDRQDKGKAVSDRDRRQDLEIMQEMGCTFIRLAHYQHGEYTYDHCDSTGIVLWTEIPLVNRVSSSQFFTASAKSQLEELIKQNYNHPCVFFWGLFNEINFLSGPDPAPLVSELNALAHQLDPTRLTTAAAMHDERATHWIPDLISWNKYFGWYGGSYEDFGPWADWMHANHSGSLIGVSEYGAGADYNDHLEDPPTTVHNSFLHPEEYQNLFHEAHWQAISERPFLWSTAIWVAFDFASDGRFEGIEPGINDKGMVSRDRTIKKDAYFYYKANWSDEPFVYISSRRFRNRTDSLIEVKVYSNCDTVALKVNGWHYPLLSSGKPVFKWENVRLDRDTNHIDVWGLRDQGTFTDSCTWYLFEKEPEDTIMPGEIQINFQPASSDAPQGYLVDDGSLYGDRLNGYTYGWSVLNTDNARDRQSTDNPLFNTLNHLQKDGIDNPWEIALDSGSYLVQVASGDPDYLDSYHIIEAEGKEILRGQHSGEKMLIGTDTVLVTDGRLTVKPAPGSLNAKINLIHISPASTGTTSGAFRDRESRTGMEDIAFYPNPVSDFLRIRVGRGSERIDSVHIVSMLGQTVYRKTGNMDNIRIDTTSWKEGLYIIQFRTKGGTLMTGKLMKSTH